MIRSSVTVSLVPEARGGPFVFWDDLPAACAKARQLGFDAVEVFAPGPDAPQLAALGKLLSDHGLRLTAVGTGAGWVKHRVHLTLPEAEGRAKARAFIKSMIEFGAAHGAPAIIGSMQGRTSPEVDDATARKLLAEGLNELGEHAARHGVPLLFEPINRYETNLITTVGAGVQLVESLATQNVKILADLFHMNIEEVDIAAALRACGRHLGHLHFVDSNRWPAGRGHLDYGPIAAALEAIGYAGYASAEALPLPDSDAAARQTIESFRRIFRRSN
jgi:sugar phosphate isomerase/epimerase